MAQWYARTYNEIQDRMLAAANGARRWMPWHNHAMNRSRVGPSIRMEPQIPRPGYRERYAEEPDKYMSPPSRTPNSDCGSEFSVLQPVAVFRDARRKLSRWCNWIGIFGIVTGLAGISASHFLFVGRAVPTLVSVIDVAAASAIILGCVVMVSGPNVWSRIHRNGQHS